MTASVIVTKGVNVEDGATALSTRGIISYIEADVVLITPVTDAQNVIEEILGAMKTVADIVIDVMTEVLGAKAKLYHPNTRNSIYGQKGNIHDYNDGYDSDGAYTEGDDLPNYEGRFLATGIFSERLQSDESIDVYDGEEVFIYIKGDDTVPKNSKVLIAWADEYGIYSSDVVYPYRVLQVEGPYGLKNQLYRKLRMVPMEVRFPT
ncbi:MAG: hypothetical protein ACTSRU_13760 [Candidatus Hodarchaeales archaeon]